MPAIYGKTDPATWEDTDLVVYADYSPFLFVVSDASEIPEPKDQAVILCAYGEITEWYPTLEGVFPHAEMPFVSEVWGALRHLRMGWFYEIPNQWDRYAARLKADTGKEIDRSGENIKWLAGFIIASVAAVAILTDAAIVGTIAKIAKWAGDTIAATWEKMEEIRAAIAVKIVAAKKIYTSIAEYIHLDELLVIERVLDLTWGQYHNYKTRLLQRVGLLSQELFGDIHVINQWINLAGMAFKDLALLEGYTWEEQDMEWLVKSAEFLEGVEDHLETYMRYPERLWYDMETALVKPIYEARAGRLSATEEGRGQIVNVVGSIERNYQHLDKRLRDNQLALPDNVEKEMGPGLQKLRSDLRNYWNDDLRGVLEGITFVAALNEERLRTVNEAQRAAAIVVKRNERLLADPAKLAPAEATEQRAVHGRIQTALADRLRAFTLEVNEIVTPGYGKALQEVWEAE